MALTAKQLLTLLEIKHADDLFVSECKDGPSQGVNTYCRLDGWAMNRSWVNLVMTGYEIKVSRSDFVNDDKWRRYLPLCNAFYFVCPPKLIDATELPDDVGLMWSSRNATRLYTKKKAPQREIDPPLSLLLYILICRTPSAIPGVAQRERRLGYWQRWLSQKKDAREVAIAINGRIAKTIDALDTENRVLRRQSEGLSDVRAFLAELGMGDDRGRFSAWDVKRRLRDAAAAIPPGLDRAINDARLGLSGLEDGLRRLREDAEVTA